MNYPNCKKGINTKRFASGNPIQCSGNDHAVFDGCQIVFFYFRLKKTHFNLT